MQKVDHGRGTQHDGQQTQHGHNYLITLSTLCLCELENEQEGYDSPVSLHWLIRKIPSYQTLQFLGISLKHKTPNKD